MSLTIQQVVDREMIHDVLTCYCRAIDRLDRELFMSVFWEDGGYEAQSGAVVSASSATFVDGIIDQTMRSLFVTTQHYITNVRIRFDGDAVAHTETYIIAYHRLKDGRVAAAAAMGALRADAWNAADGKKLDGFVGGRYVDRFERRSGEWRIKRRRLIIDWSNSSPGSEWATDAALAQFAWSGHRDSSDPSYNA